MEEAKKIKEETEQFSKTINSKKDLLQKKETQYKSTCMHNKEQKMMQKREKEGLETSKDSKNAAKRE